MEQLDVRLRHIEDTQREILARLRLICHFVSASENRTVDEIKFFIEREARTQSEAPK